MLNIDFKAHNEESKQMWERYHSGNPYRIPIMIGVNQRVILLDPKLNPKGITFQEYMTDDDTAFYIQEEFHHYVRHNIIQDNGVGIPEEGWDIFVDLMNIYEAAWLGAPVKYYEGQVPDTEPILTDEKKNLLFDKGIPDPFSGILNSHLKRFEYFKKRAKTEIFHGKPIRSVSSWLDTTDGPFTLASNLRGATEILTDMYEDPEFVHKLLDYLTESIIIRLKAWWPIINKPNRWECYRFADDSIQNISTEMYEEFVLPCHKRLINELGGKGPHMIHLCGDALRHFVTAKKELNVGIVDTGFPVDFKLMRETLGRDMTIQGGPNIQLLLTGSSKAVYEETKRILTSGILDGGKFILREANNLAPCTPLENIDAMYKAGREFGKIG